MACGELALATAAQRVRQIRCSLPPDMPTNITGYLEPLRRSSDAPAVCVAGQSLPVFPAPGKAGETHQLLCPFKERALHLCEVDLRVITKIIAIHIGPAPSRCFEADHVSACP